MESKKEDYYSLSEIVSILKSFVKYIGKKWAWLLLSILTGSGLGAMYYLVQKPKYEAVTTFIVEEKSAGSGGLVGLASQFGFDMGSIGGSGSIFAGDNILDIIRSKKVIHQVLLSPVDMAKPAGGVLADFYLEFTGLKENLQKKTGLTDFKFDKAIQSRTYFQDSVLNSIYESIINKNLTADRINKKGTIIKVRVVAQNSLFSKLLSERLVEEASKLYLNIKTGTAQLNIDRLQRRSDSLLILLNKKSYTAAVSQPLDINPGIKTAIVPMEMATRDKAVIAALYTEVTKNLEASKMLLSQQTPAIQVLDEPGASLKDVKKNLGLLLGVFIFISSAICIAVLGIIFFRKNISAI